MNGTLQLPGPLSTEEIHQPKFGVSIEPVLKEELGNVLSLSSWWNIAN